MRTPSHLFLAILAVTAAASASPNEAPALRIIPDHLDGGYAAGDTITWTIALVGLPPGAGGSPAHYAVRSGTSVVASGTTAFAAGKAQVVLRPDGPGVYVLEVETAAAAGKRSCGAAVAWPRIVSTVPEPADFDAFWHQELAELDAVPMNPRLEELDSGVPGVALCLITMDGIRGSRIHGYLAFPRAGKAQPAALQLQYWGTYPLNRNDVLGYAKKGWIALDIMAHDLPCDQPQAFYAKPPISTNVHAGADDRDKSYFLRMFLSCSRAVDYLTSRSDWNRTTLLVHGGSQGGFQGIATAALNPKVTVLAVSVPGGGNHCGFSDGQPCGWPTWVNGWARGAARDALIRTAGYYDTDNFAKRIRCPVLVGTGLLDTVSPPETQFTMFNNLRAPKRMVLMPYDEHTSEHTEFQRVMAAWAGAAAAGARLPLE